jgi:F-box and WD-40 domain protein CDC4
VAFDGVRIASGGLDTTVRIWDADTGACIALLQGHTALVCQLQLSPTLLATGGSDGRVITFSLATFAALHRIAAHDSSVTALQFGRHFLVTGGNDGRLRLFEVATGNYVRELSEPSESVWKVVCRGDTCAVMCKRGGKTVVEIWSFRPRVEV